MKNIRIGNDIKLLLKLLGSTEKRLNIHSIKAFIINTTAQAEAIQKAKNESKFISRFPVEPYVNDYCSTAYNTNLSGFPTYHALPKDHVYGSYAGIGVRPQWQDKYKLVPEHNFTEFLAPVKMTSSSDVVEIFFPAEAQLFTGEYKIVVVAQLYEPGYSANNLRTVTMDYENIFKLVSSSSEEGEDSKVTIIVGDIDVRLPEDDVYVESGNLNKNEVNLTRTDGTTVKVDISKETAWYEGD